MASSTNILLLGATGYIGGTILSKLLTHPDKSSLKIRILVRSQEKVEKINGLHLGVEAFVGSTDDSALLEDLVAESDVVFSATPVQHSTVLSVVLKGLKRRFEKTGIATRLFQIVCSVSSTKFYPDSACSGRHRLSR
jgi:N-acetyl-gamma-glutamylphosphate reductase